MHKYSFIQNRKKYWDKYHASRIKIEPTAYEKLIINCYKNLIPSNTSVLEIGCGTGNLLNAVNPKFGVGIDFSEVAINKAKNTYPKYNFFLADKDNLSLEKFDFDYIIISNLFNEIWDIQEFLINLKPYFNKTTRLIFNFDSHLWSTPARMLSNFGINKSNAKINWITKEDLSNLLEICGYELLYTTREVVIPVNIPLISNFCNKFLAKIWPFSHFALTNISVARFIEFPTPEHQEVSILVPTRNEAGNILEILSRIPKFGKSIEIIFVEGNSTDNTFEAIESAIRNHQDLNCKLIKQSGIGKGDAVRAGFEIAQGKILMILDADMTVPPEDLPRFYDLLLSNKAEFVNGVRMLYPMEKNAMQFLNVFGNKFFAAAFTWLLGQPIRDTLCGTKVLYKYDYDRICRNRSHFGDFDPFGDFDLIFGAARLKLKIRDMPIRYESRKYGDTNIQRWKHGWLLLMMVAFAARRIKFV